MKLMRTSRGRNESWTLEDVDGVVEGESVWSNVHTNNHRVIIRTYNIHCLIYLLDLTYIMHCCTSINILQFGIGLGLRRGFDIIASVAYRETSHMNT